MVVPVSNSNHDVFALSSNKDGNKEHCVSFIVQTPVTSTDIKQKNIISSSQPLSLLYANPPWHKESGHTS